MEEDMSGSAKVSLAVFDQYAVFEIVDPRLMELVAGGAPLAEPRTEGVDWDCTTVNGSCNNEQCINGNCSRNANCIVVHNLGC
jgi:hypothetical protein